MYDVAALLRRRLLAPAAAAAAAVAVVLYAAVAAAGCQWCPVAIAIGFRPARALADFGNDCPRLPHTRRSDALHFTPANHSRGMISINGPRMKTTDGFVVHRGPYR